jgi:hypothetical protein
VRDTSGVAAVGAITSAPPSNDSGGASSDGTAGGDGGAGEAGTADGTGGEDGTVGDADEGDGDPEAGAVDDPGCGERG